MYAGIKDPEHSLLVDAISTKTPRTCSYNLANAKWSMHTFQSRKSIPCYEKEWPVFYKLDEP